MGPAPSAYSDPRGVHLPDDIGGRGEVSGWTSVDLSERIDFEKVDISGPQGAVDSFSEVLGNVGRFNYVSRVGEALCCLRKEPKGL